MEKSYIIWPLVFSSIGIRVIRGEKMAANEAMALQRPNAFSFKILG